MSLLRLTFTRSRPYKKNDQAHVEQKNGSVVRRWIGHDRYEGERVTRLMNDFYAPLRLYNNFFQPSVKLINKTRHGAKVTKKYDKAKTFYQRLVAPGTLDQATTHRIVEAYRSLNPVRLRQQLQRLQDQIWAASNDARVLVRSAMTQRPPLR